MSEVLRLVSGRTYPESVVYQAWKGDVRIQAQAGGTRKDNGFILSVLNGPEKGRATIVVAFPDEAPTVRIPVRLA